MKIYNYVYKLFSFFICMTRLCRICDNLVPNYKTKGLCDECTSRRRHIGNIFQKLQKTIYSNEEEYILFKKMMTARRRMSLVYIFMISNKSKHKTKKMIFSLIEKGLVIKDEKKKYYI